VSQPQAVLALQALALGLMGIGLFFLLHLYLFTGLRRHLLLAPVPPLLFGSCLFLSSAYLIRDAGKIPIFFLLQSLGLISLTYWTRLGLKSRKEIASTGSFDPGLEPKHPGTREYALFWFFGQAIEDVAKPIVALRGEFPLNRILHELSSTFPVLSHFRFTEKGELKLKHPTAFLQISPRVAIKPLCELFERVVREFARTGRITEEEELARLIQERCHGTLLRYMDILVEEGLLYTLANGILTNRVPIGLKELDRAMEGGVPEGQCVLVVGRPSTPREAIVSSFILEGLTRGDDCLVVSSVRPASQIQGEIDRDLPGRLLVVDCYTGLSEDLSAIDDKGEVIVSPIAIEVVDVAVTRMVQRLRSKRKRVVVDILTSYLLSSKLSRLYPHILSVASTLRRERCTSIFILNPSALQREELELIQEAFDTIFLLDDEDPSLMRIAKLGSGYRGALEHAGQAVRILE